MGPVNPLGIPQDFPRIRASAGSRKVGPDIEGMLGYHISEHDV